MVFSPRVSTRIQPYFGHRSRTRLVLSSRALRQPPGVYDSGSRWQAMRTMVRQFASREVAGVVVRLVIEGPDGPLLDCSATGDAEGYIHFDVPLDPAWDLPAFPVWERAHLHWVNTEGPQQVDAYVLAPGTTSDLAVISDIDDTIVETGITGGLRNIVRNWRRVFAELPHQRVAVPGADTFYGQLGGGLLEEGEKRGAERMPATRRPFFYVSSSPWNLFSYLVAFMRVKTMPLGPIALRDWGFDRDTFGSASHGAHKTAAIAAILAMHPELRFAMIGDDTQGDLPAFAHAAAAFPGRVAAVFIRKAAEEEFSPEELAGQAALKAAGIPLWLGRSYDEGLDFLRSIGVTPGGETEHIVRTVERVADETPGTGAA
ncbi:DUF2183 domain-containing protein [Erythrobacter arachoides]|uniref:DUF2183 domain-containing protein n=1 Tax=Aurantiacibacter arachoides TaxID=1850444 RepID=A0A845A6M5_9SPHN|nr:phosphatase domain-containing protein [Aurantiacibacter arachoides]MXO94577.1 DUF2183 domain-containing protein [Aurantiacibacter arachoides]GGD62384.1 hypothetical protein GCM10011411_23280 [Aurantiacibacter arachoides]